MAAGVWQGQHVSVLGSHRGARLGYAVLLRRDSSVLGANEGPSEYFIFPFRLSTQADVEMEAL